METLRHDPLRVLRELAAYGDLVRCRVDRWNVVVVNRPDYIKHILEDNNTNYVKAGTPDLMMLKPMLGEGLMTTEGSVWLAQRRMCQPYLRRDRMQEFDGLMADVVNSMLESWDAAYSDSPMDLEEEMTRLTLNIVSKVLFSYDISRDNSNFSQAVKTMNECAALYDPQDSALLRRFTDAQRTMRSLVQHVITERVAYEMIVSDGAAAGDADAIDEDDSPLRNDLLDAFLRVHGGVRDSGMSDRQVQDQILTLLMAGHETTSKALTWTFYLLHKHPDVLARLEAELERVLHGRPPSNDDLPNLPYLSMVLDESMRVFPPVWLMSRVCRQADVIDGYRIPAGTLMIVSPYLMHSHPRYWSNPETFDPERFARDGEPVRPPYAYFPFSGGPRLCIGRALATIETRIVVAMIAQRCRLSVVSGHPVEPEALVTLRPRYGLAVTRQAAVE
jgi:cytochrome P450